MNHGRAAEPANRHMSHPHPSHSIEIYLGFVLSACRVMLAYGSDTFDMTQRKSPIIAVIIACPTDKSNESTSDLFAPCAKIPTLHGKRWYEFSPDNTGASTFTVCCLQTCFRALKVEPTKVGFRFTGCFFIQVRKCSGVRKGSVKAPSVLIGGQSSSVRMA